MTSEDRQILAQVHRLGGCEIHESIRVFPPIWKSDPVDAKVVKQLIDTPPPPVVPSRA